MQTSEEGIQQTELKSSPSNPFRNPQQTQQQTIYPQHYQSASIDSTADQKGSDFTSWSNFKTWMVRWRGSRRLVLVIVAIALLLDNMLLTVVGKLLLQYSVFNKISGRFTKFKKISKCDSTSSLGYIFNLRLHKLLNAWKIMLTNLLSSRVSSSFIHFYTNKWRFLSVSVSIFFKNHKNVLKCFNERKVTFIFPLNSAFDQIMAFKT